MDKKWIKVFDSNLNPLKGSELSGSLIVEGALAGPIEFSSKGCFSVPDRGTTLLRTVDYKYFRSFDAHMLAGLDKVYLLDNNPSRLSPAEPLRDQRLYFGQDFYFVQPGYVLNFYSEDHINNIEIEYCLNEITDPERYDYEDLGCEHPKYYFVENLPRFNKGLWSVKFRKKKDEDILPWTRYLIAVRVTCEGVYRDVEKIWSEQCTDIDNLEIKGPGDLERLSRVSYVSGYLKIQESDTLTLRGLRNISSAGDVWIQKTTKLRSLDLPPMKIKGDLFVGENHALEDVDGLAYLTEIQRDLGFNENEKITSWEGLRNLRKVGGQINFFASISLRDLEGFRNLESVGGLGLLMNDNLTSLEGLRSLRFAGYISLASDKIESLEGLRNLRVVEGDFRTTGLAFDTIEGLRNLEKIGGFLTLDALRVKSLKEMTHLRELNGLNLKGTSIETLEGLENLEALAGGLYLSDNPNLRSIDALQKIRETRDISISNNPSLASIEAFAQLQKINEDLYIGENEKLASLKGLQNLAYVGQYFMIVNNPLLKNLDYLDGLKTVVDRIEIEPAELCQQTDFSPIPENPVGRHCHPLQ